MRFVPFWIFKSYPFQMFLAHVYFRIYCPHPIGDYHRVRDCIAAGDCGCKNQDRFR